MNTQLYDVKLKMPDGSYRGFIAESVEVTPVAKYVEVKFVGEGYSRFTYTYKDQVSGGLAVGDFVLAGVYQTPAIVVNILQRVGALRNSLPITKKFTVTELVDRLA